MQNIIIARPYRFVPPYRSRLWSRLFRYYLRYYLDRTWGITEFDIRSSELLQQSVAAGHGIILAANHCRPCDPMVLGMLGVRAGGPFYTMASWHLFKNGRYQAWLIRRLGAFSVYREGLDREAIRTATNILVTADRPLVMLPEGVVTRTNDRLGALQEGVAFIARTAARQCAKATPPGKVVIHTVALKYFFQGDLAAAVGPVLKELETRLSWREQRQAPLLKRITKIGEALLALKEIDYLGRAQTGCLAARRSNLIEHLLGPLEKEWLGGRSDPSVVERIKRLRTAIVPDMSRDEMIEEEKARRWRQLADCYLAGQLWCYPPDYLAEDASPERLLETVERFEEDLTDVARIHRPLRVVIEVGKALEVNPERVKGAEDPLTKTLADNLSDMIRKLGSTGRSQ